MSEDRKFRACEPADLPRIQAGTLKAFYCEAGKKHPAKLVGTNFWFRTYDTSKRVVGWVVDHNQFDMMVYGYTQIVVDVTPTKRYAIWNQKAQRFVNILDHPTGGFKSKADAEIWHATRMMNSKEFYVVEWEIKDDL
jgi:hypothetical protein